MSSGIGGASGIINNTASSLPTNSSNPNPGAKGSGTATNPIQTTPQGGVAPGSKGAATATPASQPVGYQATPQVYQQPQQMYQQQVSVSQPISGSKGAMPQTSYQNQTPQINAVQQPYQAPSWGQQNGWQPRRGMPQQGQRQQPLVQQQAPMVGNAGITALPTTTPVTGNTSTYNPTTGTYTTAPVNNSLVGTPFPGHGADVTDAQRAAWSAANAPGTVQYGPEWSAITGIPQA